MKETGDIHSTSQNSEKYKRVSAFTKSLIIPNDSSKLSMKKEYPNVRTEDRHLLSNDEKRKYALLVDLTKDKLENAYKAIMKLDSHFSEQENKDLENQIDDIDSNIAVNSIDASESILKSAGLKGFLKEREIDLEKFCKTYEAVRKASIIADQASEKWRTRADVTAFIKAFQKTYQTFNEIYPLLLKTHNETLKDQAIETDPAKTEKQEKDTETPIHLLLLEKGSDLSELDLGESKQKRWQFWKRSSINDMIYIKNKFTVASLAQNDAKGCISEIIRRGQKKP